MHVVQALAKLSVGGSELVVCELTEHLRRLGHRVTVLGGDGPLADRIRGSGAGILDWPIGKKRLSTLRFIGRLSEWCAQQRPDIVHVHSRFPAWICWLAVRRLDANRRPMFVTTMHGHYSVSRYSSVMAKGQATICVSDHIREYTARNYAYAAGGDIVTIHGGASRDQFPWGHRPDDAWLDDVQTEFPELKGKRWLLMPGRVTRWKGHVDFLRLLARLDDIEDLHGVIVGGCRPGSRYMAELEALAMRYGLKTRITFTGDRMDIRDWMAQSALVYNLSNDPPEAFGRTVLETLCLGRPLLGWNHGGAAEIMARMFPEGAVPPLDFTELESRTRRMLADPPRVPVSDAFSLEDSMNRHLEVYESLVRKRQQ